MYFVGWDIVFSIRSHNSLIYKIAKIKLLLRDNIQLNIAFGQAALFEISICLFSKIVNN